MRASRLRVPHPRRRPGLVRLRLPAPTIRLRLTLTYGLLFLITGAALLTIGYVLVRHNLYTHDDRKALLQQVGIVDDFPLHLHHRRAISPYASVYAAARAQLRTQTLHRLLLYYVIALVAMTIVAVASGYLLAGRALAPLRRITATARRVSGRNLGERIDLHGPGDELRQLADTFDGMLVRLDSAFASQRHFVANASHELRTPLAVMRAELDVALADEHASAGELRAMGEALRETIDRCERLIASLLTLARSEALSGRGEPVELAALAGDCITDLHARASDAGVEVQTELREAWTHGEPGLLERLIANLIDNGIRHNHPGGWLRVRTSSRDGHVELEVANGGAVIDPEVASSLTEPFRRVDRAVSGFGLGLSIVRSVAEAHGGSLALHAPAGGGLEARVVLPAGEGPGGARTGTRRRILTKG
jgi:signal transduction histidine kinase